MKKARKASQILAVNYKDGTIVEENLPYRYVYYPGFYGTFFAFKENENSPLTFCGCSKKQIENYITLKFYHQDFELDELINYIFDPRDFPLEFVNSFINSNVESKANIMDHFHFVDHLCHECNRATPSLTWCHPMYGSRFVQKYGWYIRKQRYKLMVYDDTFDDEYSPDISEILKAEPYFHVDIVRKLEQQNKQEEAKALNDSLYRQFAVISRLAENEVRVKFGHKKIGEAWISETILYQIVTRLYPNECIERHYRGRELDGLELDIYLPNLKLGVEYQGVQHFMPVKHWGGEEGLNRTQERDRKKRLLCKTLGIRLIYFYHDEELNEDVVKNKLV